MVSIIEYVSLFTSAVIATLISLGSLYLTDKRLQTQKINLNLSAFANIISELGTTESRLKRKKFFMLLYDYFSDNKKKDYKFTKNMTLTYYENNDEKFDVFQIFELDESQQKYFEETSVIYDRVGFMLLNIQLPDEFIEKYIDWVCVSIVETWNYAAPYVVKKRQERMKYVEYFEELAYKSYYKYRAVKEEKNDIAKIFVLDKSLAQKYL